MQVKWEEGDIVVGRRVVKPGRKEHWMIGYSEAMRVYVSGGVDRKFTLVSLADGLVQAMMSAAELATHLNTGGMVPIEIVEPTHAS